ncbi:MAG: DUF167 domain-containing protein [bacterium]
MTPIETLETKKGLSFEVRVRPSAGRSGFAGEHAGALKVNLKSPPEDGKANKELIGIIAKALGVPASGVAIVSGETSRTKRIGVSGVSRVKLDNFLADVTKTEK